MTPNRPYLLKAFFDWLLDNELTPHLVVDATQSNVTVPSQFVNDGQIVLNIAPSAVGAFSMDLEHVGFSARFGGKPFQVYVPMAAVVAIYARENGAGTVFEPEAAYEPAEELESDVQTEVVEEPPKKPTLTIVK
ncbi:ClpXP protease specificity-enhancing factor [Agarivorans sp. 1_MG-2023]|uniref:ClpXP protease specificity-enhancing factor n=1 Tax=unclassified Agarivorans TaxID=2636026 RepID=UPI0026E2ECCC|nr:ClpXP protease specificity-enhancing factor [Agarivorans sp. 1_MG-2023]MDO6764569.1 ClpXP protease specificity-enhancing factor [Agarivorans sp. 1_MG-2023]